MPEIIFYESQWHKLLFFFGMKQIKEGNKVKKFIGELFYGALNYEWGEIWKEMGRLDEETLF